MFKNTPKTFYMGGATPSDRTMINRGVFFMGGADAGGKPDWRGKPSDWSDIRIDCPANSITLYAAQSSIYTKVGNPTIENGVVSGFSSSNYIKISSTLDISQNFEWVFCIKTNDLTSEQRIFAYNTDTMNSVYIQNKHLKWWVTGSSSNILSTDELLPNTKYFIKCTNVNGTYSLSYSTDGITYTGLRTKDIVPTTTISSYYDIGVNHTSYYSPFLGSIDLNETYIKVNDEYLTDNSQYDNLGFTATCIGGYNVFIDGVQYGSTYASGATCSITWSTSGITTGDIVTTPSLLKAHKIWIVPATEGNDITAFHCARVASSGTEEQGILWAHFNINNSINLNYLMQQVGNYVNRKLVSITALNNKLIVSSLFNTCRDCAILEYTPVFDGNNGTVNLQNSFLGCYALTVLSFKNLNATTLNSAFYDNLLLRKIKTSNINITPTNVLNAYANNQSIEKILDADYTNLTEAGTYITQAKNLKDTVLDVSAANGLTRIGCYGTSTYFMTGFKGLRVSNEAPFDYSTAPQINVSYTGMDRQAIVTLFNDLPTVTDGQIINITACTGSEYLTTEDVDIAANKGWTIVGGFNPKVVSGATPISLPNAAAGTLQYVKAFGGIEQRNLPEGHTQLDYVYMTEGSYIRVEDLPISSGYKVEFDFQTRTLNSSLRNYLGGRADGVAAGGGFRLSKLASSNNNRVVLYGFETGTEYYDSTTQFQANTRYKYTYNNGVCTLESGGSVVSTNTFTVTDNTSTDWGINDYYGNGSWSAYHDPIYAYSLKVWNPQGKLVMDLVPDLTSENVVCFYDMVTGTLREASGGTFVAGTTASVPNIDYPVDIKCNNGIVRLKDDELPFNYRRITAMSMNNNCYYAITDFHLFGATDTIRFAFSITSSGVNVLGSYTDGSAQTNYSLYAGTADTNTYLRYNGGAYNSSASLNTRYDVVWSPTGSTGMKNDSTWDTVDFETVTDFYIGTTSTTATSSKLRGTFYGNIEVDGRLKLIPCERQIDGTVGWYDTYSGNFYTPTGTNPTIEGYDASHLVVYADTDGTNLYDSTSAWNLNGTMYAGSESLVFPYSTGGNKRTYFFEVEPNTTYKISAEVFGDRLYVGALSEIVDPTTYTTSNMLIFDRTITVRNNPTTDSYFTTRATDKMVGVYYSNTTLPTNFKIQKLTEKETVSVKDSSNNIVNSAQCELLFGNGITFDEQEIKTGAITRRFGLWIFDGTETWTQSNTSSASDYRMFYAPMTGAATNDFSVQCGRCNYFNWYSDPNGDAPTYAGAPQYSCWKTTTGGDAIFRVKLPYNVDITSGPLFKAWVKARFDEGNPVFVIFPLETPTTETVAGQTMQVVSGNNTIEVTQASIEGLTLEAKYYKES